MLFPLPECLTIVCMMFENHQSGWVDRLQLTKAHSGVCGSTESRAKQMFLGGNVRTLSFLLRTGQTTNPDLISSTSHLPLCLCLKHRYFLTSEETSSLPPLALSSTVYLTGSGLWWGMISGVADMLPAFRYFPELPNESCIPGLELCDLSWPNCGLFKSSKRCDSLGLSRYLNWWCSYSTTNTSIPQV